MFHLEYFSTVDGEVETIVKWFYDTYGIEIRNSQAVEFALYSLRDINRLVFDSTFKRKNANYLVHKRQVNTIRDYSSALQAIMKDVDGIGLGRADVVSAVIAWRAVTLPRANVELKKAIKVGQKKRTDKEKYKPHVFMIPRDKKETAHLIEASRNQST